MGLRRALAAGVLGLAMTACAPGVSGGATDGGGTDGGAGVLHVAVVGDSLSFGNSTSFTADGLGDESYVRWAFTDGIGLAGGTAVPGATSVQQAARVVPVDADALVLALGTNDLAWGLPFEETSGALAQIAATVGAPRVLLLSIPPLDYGQEVDVAGFNRRLEALAAEQGWEYVDATAPVREGDGWAPGMTTDGVHYTVEAARAVGESLREALRNG